jgi:hypothetical protein
MLSIRSLTPKSFFAKAALIWTLLFAIPALAPPTDQNAPVNLGPKKAQAIGIPFSDITQIFGHMGNFGQMLQQISELRREYQMISDNFKALGELANVTFGIETGLTKFFTRLDQSVASNFDPVLGLARSSISEDANVNDLYGGFKQFFNFSEGSGSIGEKIRDAGKFSTEMMWDAFTEPGKSRKQIESIHDRVSKIRDCVEQAKGRKSVQGCMTNLEAMGITQMGRIERAIAKQTALMATQGIDSEVAKEHRREAMQHLREKGRENVEDYLSQQDTDYSRIPRLN